MNEEKERESLVRISSTVKSKNMKSVPATIKIIELYTKFVEVNHKDLEN